jgi:hypothetical protein
MVVLEKYIAQYLANAITAVLLLFILLKFGKPVLEWLMLRLYEFFIQHRL